MKKIVLCACVLISTLFLLNESIVLALSINESEVISYGNYCNSPLLNDLGIIIRNDTIKINGIDNPLFCTFEDGDEAIEKLKNKVPNILSEISELYSLDEINNDNWKDYKNGMYSLIEENDNFNEGNIEFRTLRAFFDIYENYESNDIILNSLNNVSYSNTKSNMDYAIELGNLLPYYAPLAKMSSNYINSNSIIMPLASINVTPAVNYASTYATNPNKSDYHYFSNSDCTNFVSQILEASGVQQVVYESEHSGWWHKVTTGWFGIKTHTHSRSWTLADTFSRYMGVGYTTKSHYSFSENIKKGDFIAADFDSDGDWDHTGFVTDKNSLPACHSDGDYYDYKVAQHTKNYHEWTSTSKNGWDSIGTDGGTYARVRR